MSDEKKWTPGPWSMRRNIDPKKRGWYGHEIFGSAARRLALTDSRGLFDGADEANARLIAAAPEMYKAEILGRVLWEALAEQWSRLTAAQQRAAQAYFKANRSALAKADGKVAP